MARLGRIEYVDAREVWKYEEGQWALIHTGSADPLRDVCIDPNNADEIARNSTIAINVIGGCPPYTLSVSGNGFSLTDNTLFADDTAAGTRIAKWP